jgi:hypothetical protein
MVAHDCKEILKKNQKTCGKSTGGLEILFRSVCDNGDIAIKHTFEGEKS